jgi:hypothetical protein
LEQCFALIQQQQSARPDFYAAARISYAELLIGLGDLQSAAVVLSDAKDKIGETSGLMLAEARLAFALNRILEGEKVLARLSTRSPDMAVLAERELAIHMTILGDRPRAVSVLELLQRQLKTPDFVIEAFLAANLQMVPQPWSPGDDCGIVTQAALSFLDSARLREMDILTKGTDILCKDNEACTRCRREIDQLRTILPAR